MVCKPSVRVFSVKFSSQNPTRMVTHKFSWQKVLFPTDFCKRAFPPQRFLPHVIVRWWMVPVGNSTGVLQTHAHYPLLLGTQTMVQAQNQKLFGAGYYL